MEIRELLEDKTIIEAINKESNEIKEKQRKILLEAIKNKTIKDKENFAKIKKAEEQKYKELKKELTADEFDEFWAERINCIYGGDEYDLVDDVLLGEEDELEDEFLGEDNDLTLLDFDDFIVEYSYNGNTDTYILEEVLHKNRVVFVELAHKELCYYLFNSYEFHDE